ncbi:hypothetical protein SMZ86_003796 [Cronobacter sakazakii]|nr:hypothetical protein [Cronobacter sakazakii]
MTTKQGLPLTAYPNITSYRWQHIDVFRLCGRSIRTRKTIKLVSANPYFMRLAGLVTTGEVVAGNGIEEARRPDNGGLMSKIAR